MRRLLARSLAPDDQVALEATGPANAIAGILEPHVARAVRTPGPLRAFYERLRARRGAQIALVATGRKLCVLFWHLLTREQDYAFGRPSLTRHKLRRLELMAGDPPRRGQRSGSKAGKREQLHERELSEQVEQAYRRLVADWQQQPKKSGAGATPGRASSSHQTGQAARQGQAPDPAL